MDWSRRAVIAGMGALALPIDASCSVQPAAPEGMLASRFATLAAAVERWTETGGTLLIDRDFDLIEPITMLARSGLSYRLTADRPRTLTYRGPRYHWALCVYSEGGNPFIIDGNLTIDGANLVAMPLFLRFEPVNGDQRRDFTVDGLTLKNARAVAGRSPFDGSATNAYGASGILFMGGFDRLHLNNVSVANVTRAVGAGVALSKGCLGIGVVALLPSTASAKHVLIENFSVSRVDSDDPPSSRNRTDMDGVLVFQSAERDGTRPIIRHGVIREAAGRGVKIYAPGGGGITQDLKIYRSVPGNFYGSADINHQHGDGLVADITLFYSNRAHEMATTVVSMSAGNARPDGFAFSTGEVRNIRIHDTTGRPKYALVGLQYNVTQDARERSYRISDIIDEGRSRYLFLPGALGTDSLARITIDNCEVNLTEALMASEDPAHLLRVSLRRSRLNRARPVEAKVMYDGRPIRGANGLRLDVDSTVDGLVKP